MAVARRLPHNQLQRAVCHTSLDKIQFVEFAHAARPQPGRILHDVVERPLDQQFEARGTLRLARRNLPGRNPELRHLPAEGRKFDRHRVGLHREGLQLLTPEIVNDRVLLQPCPPI